MTNLYPSLNPEEWMQARKQDDEIKKMVAGSELDAVVAASLGIPVKPYSTELVAAFEIVEMYKNKGFKLETLQPCPGIALSYACDFHAKGRPYKTGKWIIGQSISEIICKAILLWVYSREEEF